MTPSAAQETLRDLERASLVGFVGDHAPKFRGRRVLDYGAGRQPYRDLIARQEPLSYVAFDRRAFPANVSGENLGDDRPLALKWDVILCTQILQYVPAAGALLAAFHQALVPDGVLILTGPTNWPEVEPEDHRRFTVAGIRAVLDAIGFNHVTVRSRAAIRWGPEELSLGWGATAYR